MVKPQKMLVNSTRDLSALADVTSGKDENTFFLTLTTSFRRCTRAPSPDFVGSSLPEGALNMPPFYGSEFMVAKQREQASLRRVAKRPEGIE